MEEPNTIMASFGDDDIYRGQMRQNTPLNVALCKLWYRMWQLTGFSQSGDEGGGTQQATGLTAATSNGAVAAGFKSVAFITSSDWAGTINGASFPASASISYNADSFRTLQGINYTRSAGTLYIGTVSN